MKYYAGVDGGGTKTAYALFDENKNILAETRSPGSNHENLEGSFEEAADILIAGLTSFAPQEASGLNKLLIRSWVLRAWITRGR